MSRHGLSVEIVWRNADNTQRTWRARCGCSQKWTGPEYEIVEDEWRKHVHTLTGVAPKPCGSKEARWSA